MKVVAFRHVPFEGAGRLDPVLASHGIQLEYADLYRPDAPRPDLSTAAGLIVLGGPMSVNDDLPWLREEEQMVKRFLNTDKPVLGICLGSQLIAKLSGAKVYRNQCKEIGFFEVYFTGVAKSDSLFVGLQPAELVFHWHGETYDLPPGAALLASSDACKHQAYRIGNNVYGLQFHLEVTPEMIADWCTHDENCGDVRELEQPLDPDCNRTRLSHLAGVVFSRWCHLVSQESPTSPTA